MKYAFFGTPEFSAIILEKLIAAAMPPSLIICNPDRPVGRKKILTVPATKIIAQKYNIPVWQPEKLESKDAKAKIGNVDFAAVAAYSKILPKEIIAIPRLGTIGVHPSLLPRYRGATPIQSFILNGEEQTGITLYLMDEGVDHGPILAQQALYENIAELNYETIMRKLAELAGEMLIGFLPEFAKEETTPEIQDESKATFTKKFKTEDGFVDLTKDDPKTILRKIRALNPEPGVYTFKDNRRMKIWDAELVQNKLKLKKIQFEGEKSKEL